jgi:Putative Se/S carrier protein-like
LEQGGKMVKEGDCVAIFHSIQRVMKAEKQLLAREQDILLIPVPRRLSADCGMAIRFPLESLASVRSALDQINMQIAELWLMKNGEYEQLD